MKDFICGDCLEGIKEFPDDYFDLAIVDPPYGIGMDRNAGKSTKYQKKNWDKSAPNQEYFDELIRVSQQQIIWGANHFISKIPHDTPCWIIWDKRENFIPTRTFADGEMAWTSFKSPMRIFRFYWDGFLQKVKEHRIHPTQKPVQLYKWLLRNYAEPTFKILDTHVGSGSSLIAFEDFGCEYIGYEIDSDYYNDALKRLNQHKAQLNIFQK